MEAERPQWNVPGESKVVEAGSGWGMERVPGTGGNPKDLRTVLSQNRKTQASVPHSHPSLPLPPLDSQLSISADASFPEGPK